MRVLLIIILSLSLPVLADVRLWVSDTTTQGDIGGRTGADGVCDSDTNKPAVASSTTRAFISVDTDDEIRDMPSLYNIPSNEVIFRQDGTTQIAPNYAALLNTTDPTPLSDFTALSTFTEADLINSVSEGTFLAGFVGTGSQRDGSLSANCSNLTSNSNLEFGAVGNKIFIDSPYIAHSLGTCDTAAPYITLLIQRQLPLKLVRA